MAGGSILTRPGTANFAGTTYRLQHGQIFFTNPVMIQPIIDIDATTRVEEYDVTIGLHGNLSNLTPTFRSEPPLAQADVISLLALNAWPERPLVSVSGSALASPSARKAALENDVNIDNVRGSGEFGRIVRDDVLRAFSGADRAAPSADAPSPAQPRPPAGSPLVSVPSPAKPAAAQLAQMINQGGGFPPPIPGVGYGSFKVPQYRPNEGDKVIPFTRRRRITADHMTYSKFASPHVVTVAEVDLHKASRLRERSYDR